MIFEGAAFILGVLAFPALCGVVILVCLSSAAQAVPLKLYRSFAKWMGWKASHLVSSKKRDGDYDMPYLRETIEEIPAFALGLSALMVMIADQRVALAVNAHSTYFEAPFSRLFETLHLVYSLTRNDEKKSKASAKYIDAKHRHINGPGYDATSQSAQKWVWATLVAALEDGYKSMHPESETVSADELESYLDNLYVDWQMFAKNFGLDMEFLPEDREAFYDYYNNARDNLVPVNEDSQKLARGLFSIPDKPYLWPLYPFTWYLKTLAVARLPEDYRPFYPPRKRDSLSFSMVRSTFVFLWWNQAHIVRHSFLAGFIRLGYRISPDPTKYGKAK